MDTQVNRDITLTLEDGRSVIFSPYKNGHYYFDTNTGVTNPKSKLELDNYFFLNTVSDNKQYFLRRKLKERIILESFKNIYSSLAQTLSKDTSIKIYSQIVRSQLMTSTEVN